MASTGSVFSEDNPECVNHTRNESEESQHNVDEQSAAATSGDENCDGRENKGEQKRNEPRTVSHPPVILVLKIKEKFIKKINT